MPVQSMSSYGCPFQKCLSTNCCRKVSLGNPLSSYCSLCRVSSHCLLLQTWPLAEHPTTCREVQPHDVAAEAAAATLPEQLLLCHVQGDVTHEQVAHMNITQFRQVMATAKLVAPNYSSDKVDDVFNNMAALSRVSQCGGMVAGDTSGQLASRSDGVFVWGEDATKGVVRATRSMRPAAFG